MVHIFNGREFAKAKLDKLKSEVEVLLKKGIKPVLASIIVGEDPASKLYVGLKKKAGESIGIEVQVFSLDSSSRRGEIIQVINDLNEDDNIHGIMIQLPLPEKFSKEDKNEIINSIASEKDVDGLKNDSLFLHPTSKAVLDVLNYAMNISPLKEQPFKVCIVGSTGMVGVPLIKELKRRNGEFKKDHYEIYEVNSKTENLENVVKEADILISCVGEPDMISADMVKNGSILIDVGAPVGDIQKEAYEKASFVSPVPGGIGPITISCLMENLILVIDNNFTSKII